MALGTWASCYPFTTTSDSCPFDTTKSDLFFVYINNSIRNLSGGISIILCVLVSCLPHFDSRTLAIFQNCTDDTLFIGASHFDNIDSVDYPLYANCRCANSNTDSVDIILWKGKNVHSDALVFPDSTFLIDADWLFMDNDTCYLFLIKWEYAKKCSWNEIRNKKLFNRKIVTIYSEGNYNNFIE